jgi:hypothetical protein
MDFQHRLAAFAAGRDGSEADLPGWQRFRAAFGDDAEARTLFVDMQRAEPDVMRAFEQGPGAIAKILDTRLIQVQQAQRASGQTVALGSLVAFLFAVGDEHVPLNFQTAGAVGGLCGQPAFGNALEEPAKRKILRKLLGAYIERSEGWGAYQSLNLAMRYDLKEGLVPAVKIVRNRGEQAHIRQYAILTLAKLGDESHFKLIVPLLEDKTRCATQRINNVTFETQLRDVALVAILILQKKDPKAYGFERLQPSPATVFVLSSAGFEDDAKRAQALDQWKKSQIDEKQN